MSPNADQLRSYLAGTTNTDEVTPGLLRIENIFEPVATGAVDELITGGALIDF